MANLKLKNPSGGSLNLVSADGASDLTVTFPAKTGTVMVSGNQPTFYAFQQGATQTLSTSVVTKITYDSTSGYWNSSGSGYSTSTSTFTPTVEGYYQITASVGFASSSGNMTSCDLYLYKNGSAITDLRFYQTGTNMIFSGTYLVYANGSSDYFEIYVGYAGTNSQPTVNQADRTYFGACLLRTA